MSLADVEAFAIPLAQSAGLAELEATWRYELMMQSDANTDILLSRMQPFVDLQRRRLRFSELGSQLEKFAPRVDPLQRYTVWLTAADAYRSAGETGNELRILASIAPSYLGRDAEQRLYYLLLARNPQELVRRAAVWSAWGQNAADYAVANGDVALAHSVVSLRGRIRPPVWTNAYNALTGLYFAEAAPEVDHAFLAVLGDSTIAERVSRPVDRSQQLAGDTWFYYGSRYGEYYSVSKKGDPEDYLPAILEQSPASASGYVTVADYYVDSGDTTRAIADYQHTLELAPSQAAVYDRLALAYFKQGARADAIAQWKHFFSVLQRQVDSSRVPEGFWADFSRVCDHLRGRKLFSELKPAADALLRAYLRRNGNYRSNTLLRSAYLSTPDPAAATNWLLDLASAAPDPSAVLADVVEAPWIPLAQRAPVYQRILQAKQDVFSKSQGLERENAQQVLRSWQVRWISYLVAAKQFALAGDAIAALPKETREAEAAAIVPLDLQVAARTGHLDSTLDGYRADPQAAPPAEVLRTAARQLSDAGDKQSARKVLEFVFAREVEDHRLVAANFLGLAEIRIAAGDTLGAVELLRRLVVVVGNPFENLDPAAALLEKTGHPAEAVEFLDQLVKSTPWEGTYRLRLAKARLAAGQDAPSAQRALASIASSSEISYSLRAEAAVALAGSSQKSETGSAELNLLARGVNELSFVEADRPFFYEARLAAARSASDARVKVQMLGSALNDTPARDEARIPLFQAAAGLQADEFARAVIGPLLRQRFLTAVPAAPPAEDEMIGSEAGNETGDNEPGGRGDAAFKLPPAQQAQVAGTLAEVLIRLDRLSEALPYLDIARRLEKAPDRRKKISAQIADVRAQLRRQQLNAARQPILHEALEQDRLVRPRLLARAVPGKPPTKGGVKR
jgi:tetratricopeptide (TPR) repeat protein